jgi:hypothetical protein
MNYISSAALSAATICMLSAAPVGIAASEEPASVASKQTSAAAAVPARPAKALVANQTKAGKTAEPEAKVADPLAANVLGDAELATQRGGTDTHLNQINATGTVAGNVASNLTTGTNTIGEGAFSNSSGIPIVIQNSGNNVLIQNSTILNLQLTNPK